MKFIIDDDVFSKPENYQALISSVLMICQSRRHSILITDIESSNYKIFLDFMGNLSSLIEGTIKNDPREFLLEGLIFFDINNAPTSYSDRSINILELPLILKKKFNLYLENSINDYLFLLFFCTERQKEMFNECEKLHEFGVINGGGIGTLKNLVEQESFDKNSSFVLFDSDNLPLQPDYVNINTQLMEKMAISKSANFHKLNRRNIENYIPISALKNLFQSSPDALVKINVMESLYSRSDCFRKNFSLKDGLNKDINNVRSIPNHNDLTQFLKPMELTHLTKGFGKDIAEKIFSSSYPESVKKEDIDAWTEVNGIISTIQNLM